MLPTLEITLAPMPEWEKPVSQSTPPHGSKRSSPLVVVATFDQTLRMASQLTVFFAKAKCAGPILPSNAGRLLCSGAFEPVWLEQAFGIFRWRVESGGRIICRGESRALDQDGGGYSVQPWKPDSKLEG
jgi:hypothetical protein